METKRYGFVRIRGDALAALKKLVACKEFRGMSLGEIVAELIARVSGRGRR